MLEVIIALGILATLFVILFGTYSAAVGRAARARELSQTYHEARVLLDLMASDLRSAYVKDVVEQAQQSIQQPKAQPYTFVGEDRTEGGLPADKLAFTTFLALSHSEVPQAGICRVTYSLEPVADPPQRKALFRGTNCSVDPEPSDGDHLVLLTDLAQGLDVKYYDERGSEYHEWNSRDRQGGKRLPIRVKITLELANDQGQLRAFEMSTELALSR